MVNQMKNKYVEIKNLVSRKQRDYSRVEKGHK
jgi:hypothetical protein